jgi:Protein of unknown function (DUF3108)
VPAYSPFRMIAAAALIVFAAPSAHAQAHLDATYTAHLAGIPVGKGTWTLDVDDTQFNTTITGSTLGLIRVFTGGQGTSTGRGTFGNNGQLASSAYSSTIKTSRRTDQVDLSVVNNTVKDSHVDPPIDLDPERVPFTDATRQGIVDPMAASLVRISGTGDVLVPEACQRKTSVFDGKLRYDLSTTFKRMDKVKSGKGYTGPVVVCAVLFTPVAGHIPTRATVKYLTEMRDMEVWLAPIAGTRFLVPYRLQAPTPLGTARLEADDFVVVPQPTRAATTKGVKTQ